ncbi:hypothetical protein FE810_16550 [Thalassotalea litorea]|uniref:Glycinamide ribonucleotide synthetase n=1 Tax=Thalassotalea litorea TaxID=2020715 RepID=A0A5R9IBH0_9GAMM|nr:phosphoribosylglycinamide synthetase C domain-containing protein [Thalassotalea litorea]TLU59951.1 hypothetical protein FE810_16550 [Thalassotalea litorea]
MKILVIGSGGREHALAWKASQSVGVEKVFVAPGNAGTITEAKLENVAISVGDIPALVEFAQQQKIELTIVGPEQPLVDGVVDAFQQAGLMISEDGTPKVIEYNCRFGDPETQPIMMRLQSDLVALCLGACAGKLDQATIEFDSRAAVGVVLAAKGYPASYPKGDVILGLETNKAVDRKTFHAGTTMKDGHVVTAGGRVLCATALGQSVTEAQQSAYQLLEEISWEGVSYRTDIAYRAIARENS